MVKMDSRNQFDIVIMGGGLAGLVSSILLSRAGYHVCLIEKKKYPFHRVCGEYISNEVLPFLEKHNLFPHEPTPSNISKFQLTSTSGRAVNLPLDLGAFGISRYRFDKFLLDKAIESGAVVRQGEQVIEFDYVNNEFVVKTSKNDVYSCRMLIGAHGKRSKIDHYLRRDFYIQRSPYIGVKYHIKYDFPEDTIALHNFKNGYCGISKIENDTFNLCYLSHRNNLTASNGEIQLMENNILSKNPCLKEIFKSAEFLFDKPQVINEISFEPKPLIENHVLMVGDAAGMITPLCGNGMAMAIHGAKILSESIITYWQNSHPERDLIENNYELQWKKLFSTRIKVGRKVQQLFGSTSLSNFSVVLAKSFKPLSKGIISLTHGQPFS